MNKTAAQKPIPHMPTKEEMQKTNRICKFFIIASLLYFLAGSFIGLLILSGIGNIPAFVHVHLNFVGWVSMMIFGVGYKLLPTGFAMKGSVYSFPLAYIHFWLSNIGLLGTSLFYYLRYTSMTQFNEVGLLIFGLILFISVVIFIYNMLMTFRN